jgi:hypothetical protein
MTTLVDAITGSLPVMGVLILAVQLGALWVGWRIGRHRRRHLSPTDDDPLEGVGVVVGALLGLLAFTMGVTISIAEARYEDRRRTALEEANAIGTAWLRAQAVGDPRGGAVADLLKGYTETRIAWLRAGHDDAALGEATRATERAQAAIWALAAAIGRERPDPVTATLLTSLNETFDLATRQRWAFGGRLPRELPWMLVALTVLSVGGIAYQWGLRDRWHPVLAMLLLSAWTGSLLLIADLSHPRIGLVRVNAAPLEWVMEGMRAGLPAVPPPR